MDSSTWILIAVIAVAALIVVGVIVAADAAADCARPSGAATDGVP